VKNSVQIIELEKPCALSFGHGLCVDKRWRRRCSDCFFSEEVESLNINFLDTFGDENPQPSGISAD
jgi:hypothetical protein